MPAKPLPPEVCLGRVGANTLRLSAHTLRLSAEHARSIAAALGARDAESSLAAYWALDTRLRQWQQLVDRLGMERVRQASCLEVGSGLGLFVLTGRALGLHVLGVEPSSTRYERSLQIARALFADHHLPAPIAQSRAEALPLGADTIDVVTSFQTFEHVADLPRTLAEIRRVLRPGGTLFAQAPNYASFYEAHYGFFMPLAAGKRVARGGVALRGRPNAFLDHLQWISPARMRVLLREAGFRDIEVAPIGPALAREPLDALPAAPAFRFRRGMLEERAANIVAGALYRLGAGADYFPQMEIWATA
jgi:SAM-dependent methyltransferase